MRQSITRRALAAAGASVLAGSMLVLGGASAGAAPVSATVTTPGSTVESKFAITRTVSDASPTHGDTVTVTTRVERTTGAYLLYEVRDFTPECMELVPGSATASKGGDIAVDGQRVRWTFGLGRIADPFVLTAKYTVTCGAGVINTGGAVIKRAPAGSDTLGNDSMGPSVTVLRKGTSVFLNQPTNPQLGQTVPLNAVTTNVPDGAQLEFTVDGQPVGSGQVSGGQATLQWTPTSIGTRTVRATFVQTPTRGGSVSVDRTVVVSQANVGSSVTVSAGTAPKVGQLARLTASVSPAAAGGEVVFEENGARIGSAPVGADGQAAIDWIPAVAGLRTIDVHFSGRSGVDPSSGAAPYTVAAADPQAVATTTTLDPVASASAQTPIALKATVSTGIAGGTVTFHDGQTVIGTAPVGAGGVATLVWTPSAAGERTVRAVFSGEGVYTASQATTQAVITPRVVDPLPDDPGTGGLGSLGSVTGSLGG